MNDERLGKTAKKRLTIAYVYGLLRRTFNLSLNNPKKYYLKSYNMIYCINRYNTLANRSGLNLKTIGRAIKILSEAKYLITIINRPKHLTYIGMPLVVKDYLAHPNILGRQIYRCHWTKILLAEDKIT